MSGGLPWCLAEDPFVHELLQQVSAVEPAAMG